MTANEIKRKMSNLLDKYKGVNLELGKLKLILDTSEDDYGFLIIPEAGTKPSLNISDEYYLIQNRFAFNTVDSIGFVNLDNINIRQFSLSTTPTFTVDEIVVIKADEQSTGNEITIKGTNFSSEMMVTLESQGGGVELSNVVVTLIDTTHFSVSFDTSGNISNDINISVNISKGIYTTTSVFSLDVDLAFVFTDTIEISSNESITLQANEYMETVTSVISDNPNIVVLNYVINEREPSLTVGLDTSAASAGDSFNLTAVVDGETAIVACVISNSTPVLTGFNEPLGGILHIGQNSIELTGSNMSNVNDISIITSPNLNSYDISLISTSENTVNFSLSFENVPAVTTTFEIRVSANGHVSTGFITLTYVV